MDKKTPNREAEFDKLLDVYVEAYIKYCDDWLRNYDSGGRKLKTAVDYHTDASNPEFVRLREQLKYKLKHG